MDPGAGAELVLSWTAFEGASSYRVWSAPTAKFSRPIRVGESTEPTLTIPDARIEATNAFFRVQAVNSCNQGGP